MIMDIQKSINILKKDILDNYDNEKDLPISTPQFNYIFEDYNMDKIKSVDVIITIINYSINVTVVSPEYTDDCVYVHFKEFFSFGQDCEKNCSNKRESFENNIEIIIEKIYRIRDEVSYSKILDCFLPINEIIKFEEIYLAREFITRANNIDKCCVCYDVTSVKTSCNHFLCRECFNNMTNKTCPICRVDL